MPIREQLLPLLLIVGVLAAAPARALPTGLFVDGDARNAADLGQATYRQRSPTQPVEGSAHRESQGNGGHAQSRAEWWRIESSATNWGVGFDPIPPSGDVNGARADAAFRDRSVLQAADPLLNGRYATVRVEVEVMGAAQLAWSGAMGDPLRGSFTMTEYYFFATGCDLCGGSFLLDEMWIAQSEVVTHEVRVDNQLVAHPTMFGIWRFDVVAKVGDALELSSDVWGQVSTSKNFGESHSTRADSSMRWRGITSIIIDEQAYYPAGFSLMGTTGIDWINATPVPEPGTYALMALGLIAIGLRAQRRVCAVRSPALA